MIINLGCASIDNHIPRDDIFDYHPLRECNIYILSHIRDTICRDNPKSAYAISSFPPCREGNRNVSILNGERGYHAHELMASDVNKWRDLTQSLRQSYVLETFLYVCQTVKTVNWNMW